ncbi:protein SPMIP3 [Sminthopsis crassicaudata]|uniref:protein SPMIP3 n=1 Tax=Sminthopsis crassicaudata TaxID=9301 RepID=UPI003D68DA85
MSYIRLREFKDRKPVQYSRLCIVPQGKYINGYYSGQLAKVHYVKELQRPLGYPEDLISCYQPKSPPVQFDQLTLANYISYRRMDPQPPKGWYKETTYQRAFSLPFYKFESDQILATPVLDPKPLTSLPKLF